MGSGGGCFGFWWWLLTVVFCFGFLADLGTYDSLWRFFVLGLWQISMGL